MYFPCLERLSSTFDARKFQSPIIGSYTKVKAAMAGLRGIGRRNNYDFNPFLNTLVL